jgi:molecular chaperone DnaK
LSVSVGIDLGTTFSAVAYIDPQTKLPIIIPNSEGNKITPSVIQFLNGAPVFGTDAESAFNAGEPNCAATFKRGMGKDETYCEIDGKPYTAEDLSALLLRHLKNDAETALGDMVSDAVITVPAYFYSREREATIRAAEAAGLKVKKIIDEPNAAAMTYGLSHWRENANILVYDLGGGTFDVTLTRMGKDGELITITTRGDHYLGGRDWDNRIEDLLHDKFSEESGVDTKETPETIAIIRGLTEGIKKQLSAMEIVKVSAQIPEFGNVATTITRTEFADNTIDLIERTGDLCRAVLDEAGLTKNDLTDILLVGGSTRMPQVSQFLTSLFGKKPIAHVNPDEAVALGAAIQSSKDDAKYSRLAVVEQNGAKVTDRKAISGRLIGTVKPEKRLTSVGLLQLQETTAHAMGIIATNAEVTKYINDTIIPANHPRPVRAAKAFTQRTRAQGDNEMEIFVLQGSSENPLDNQIPYRFIVSGIRHIPSQRGRTLVRVQYSYDQNGVIHVQARQEQDDVDLPIRKEAVPSDMSIYGLPITEPKATESSSRSMGVYSQWAGVNRIPSASADKYGNAVGDEFDLVEDGTFDGEIIYVLNLCHRECTLTSPGAALSKKGFKILEDISVPSIETFKANLGKASQFWLISDCTGYLSGDFVDTIEDYFNQGHGVYIWGDNDPYYVDANKVAMQLFGITMSGNSEGAQVVSLMENGKTSGVVPNHLISTGVVNIFEGRTIAEVQTSNVIEPLIYGFDGKVVTACYDDNGKRALIDGGFTRLYCDWDSAGTDRYIVNAAAWLVNLERFSEKLPKGKEERIDSNDEETTREVATWDN